MCLSTLPNLSLASPLASHKKFFIKHTICTSIRPLNFYVPLEDELCLVKVFSNVTDKHQSLIVMNKKNEDFKSSICKAYGNTITLPKITDFKNLPITLETSPTSPH